MNIKRLKALREHLASLPAERFDMTSCAIRVDGAPDSDDSRKAFLANECDTAGCIAGHTIALFAPETPVHRSWMNTAAQILELNSTQENWLFLGLFQPNKFLSETTLPEAVDALDQLIRAH